jgi:hypothetical protein
MQVTPNELIGQKFIVIVRLKKIGRVSDFKIVIVIIVKRLFLSFSL